MERGRNIMMKSNRGDLARFLAAVLILAVACAVVPETANAVPRKESAEPLLGDPTDTNDGPVRGPDKAASKLATWNSKSAIGSSRVQIQRSGAIFRIILLNYHRWIVIGGSLR